MIFSRSLNASRRSTALPTRSMAFWSLPFSRPSTQAQRLRHSAHLLRHPTRLPAISILPHRRASPSAFARYPKFAAVSDILSIRPLRQTASRSHRAASIVPRCCSTVESPPYRQPLSPSRSIVHSPPPSLLSSFVSKHSMSDLMQRSFFVAAAVLPSVPTRRPNTILPHESPERNAWTSTPIQSSRGRSFVSSTARNARFQRH